jgi:hypothetical protein
MKNLPTGRRLVAFVPTVAIAMFVVLTEEHAQTQDLVLPRLSVPTAEYFNNNPAAWEQFLSQLPQRPAGPPQANVLPPSSFGGTWTAVTTAPSIGLSNPLLLTDGTVIVHVEASQRWYKLTPDINGDYATGSWSSIAPLPSGYGPRYFASAVLNDGRVIIQGGEYNLNDCSTNRPHNQVWTSKGAIYDPIANTWTNVNPPSGSGWTNTATCGHANGGVGDAASIVLPNGTFMLSSCCGCPAVDAFLNEQTLTYNSANAPIDPSQVTGICTGKPWQSEQGYTLLHDGNVLTIDVWDPPHAQKYNPHADNPHTGSWTDVANTPVLLPDPCGTFEIGPAVTRRDGTVVVFGGYSCASADPTAIYTPFNNTWETGPNVPQIGGQYYDLADAPAALLPNGNILFAASPGFGLKPTHFFEFTSPWSLPANGILQVADPIYNAANSGAYYYNFLVLPNGQILMTDFSDIAEVYTPTSSPNFIWVPISLLAPVCVTPGNAYYLNGLQLAGLSQGAAYGDDVQGATNYPLVKIVNNSTGHVFYARTYGFSTRSIAPLQFGSANFQVSSGTESGASTLYVVANGISSFGRDVAVASRPDANDTNRRHAASCRRER